MNSPISAFIRTAAGILAIPCASAAPYTWDASGGTPLNDGGGSWAATGGTNWFDGTTYGAWGNTFSDVATFGVGSGAAGTINVGTVNANGLTFIAAGSGNYLLSGGTITLGGTTPTINAAVNASISSILAGSAGMTKSGAGTLTLTGVSTYSGGTIIDNGTLSLESTTGDTAIRGIVAVNSGGTLRISTTGSVRITDSLKGPGVVEVFRRLGAAPANGADMSPCGIARNADSPPSRMRRDPYPRRLQIQTPVISL